MKTKHTPGPWSYNRDEGGCHGHVISTSDYIVAELPDFGDGAAPHTEANARLIAAAPELLDALKVAIATSDPSQHKWVAEARAAIAKAERG